MKRLQYVLTSAAVMFAPVVALAKATCTVNGEEVACPEFSGALLIIPILFGIVGIIAFIFWLKMLIHAIRNPIKDKALWVIVLLLFTVLGAIVYYFAVKKPMSA